MTKDLLLAGKLNMGPCLYYRSQNEHTHTVQGVEHDNFNKTDFYTALVHPTKVFDTSAAYEWNYKGSVLKDNENTFANYCEYSFTTSHAMRYEAYFHLKYPVE
jgi:hypothetical protein